MLLQLVGRSLTLNEMVANRGRGSAQNARTSDCTVSEASGARYACRWGRLLNIPVARIRPDYLRRPARDETLLYLPTVRICPRISPPVERVVCTFA